MSDSDNPSSSRHSFRKSAVIQHVDMNRNEFGQTVLGSQAAESSDVQAYVDPSIGIGVKQDIFTSPKMQELAQKLGFEPSSYLQDDGSLEVGDNFEEPTDEELDDQEMIDLPHLDKASLEEFKKLAAAMQKLPMVQAKIQEEVAPMQTKLRRTDTLDRNFQNCIDPDCKALIKSGSKFCSECGKQQLARFCVSCSYAYEGIEKFCPNCGIKR